jgi:hypothetical protein
LVTASATSSITIALFCDVVSPAGGVRSIVLSDAELRTDQDFTCNYQAQICPIVFEDANINGTKETVENIYNNIIVELRRAEDNFLVGTITTNPNLSEYECFTELGSGQLYNVIVTNPPTAFSTTSGDSISIESTLLTAKQNVSFGYSEGGILIDASPQVFFPNISVQNQDAVVQTNIPFVEVRDLRSANLPWSVTATSTDFNSIAVQGIVLPIEQRLTLKPGTVTVVNRPGGASQGASFINRGGNYTVQSTSDQAGIFNTGATNGTGQYRINVNVDYLVPAYSPVSNYQAVVTFVLI